MYGFLTEKESAEELEDRQDDRTITQEELESQNVKHKGAGTHLEEQTMWIQWGRLDHESGALVSIHVVSIVLVLGGCTALFI